MLVFQLSQVLRSELVDFLFKLLDLVEELPPGGLLLLRQEVQGAQLGDQVAAHGAP